MSSNKDRLLEHYKFKDSIKAYKGYKAKSPEETINFIESAFKKLGFGILYTPKKRVSLKTYYPFQTGYATLFPNENNQITLLRAGGKGVTPKLSQASGTAELIERFTGYGLVSSGNITHYLSSIKLYEIWKNKRENNAVAEQHPLISLGPYELISNIYHKNYNEFSKAVCYSITNNTLHSYPEEFIFKLEGSNGLASGNTLEEATLHAIFEVIERLAGMYVMDNLPRCNKINKESFTHPTIKKLMEATTSLGFEFEILDFSSLFDVPLIVTIFDHPIWKMDEYPYTNENVRYPKMITGVDTNPQDAAMRCFTELFQVAEPIYLSIYNELETQGQFKTSKMDYPFASENLLRAGFTAFSNGNCPISVDLRNYKNSNRDEISIQEVNDIYDINQKVEIDGVVNRLKNHNLEVFVHDITHSVLEFPVARVIVTGGADYFSKIPLQGYNKIILGTKDKNERYSLLNRFIEKIFTPNELYQIIKSEKWVLGENLDKFVDIIKTDLCYTGLNSPLFGLNVNKFYFIGMLYLKMKNYEIAENYFNAALYDDPNNLPSLIGLAYVFSKKGNTTDFENVMNHMKTINKDNLDLQATLKEFDDPIIRPNPLEPCDFQCSKKNKPHLCKQCFFGYVPPEKFLKQRTSTLLQ